ncbi:BatD family protein [Salmonirosea aquatica]|uniref:Protein BatD n=1 Tax=Salmonirosea aquatica TaxID=2654236 RepID=A0A7C9FS16_9BACT|nr:hypothetical protein [Cytophagaceae bacterium SJW1-29]
MKVYAFISIFLWCLPAWAQRQPEADVQVETGEKNLTLDQPFIVTIIVKNHANRPTVTFPDLEGLEKRSASATSTTNSVGGKIVIIQTISQQYFALREGKYTLPEFSVIVDGTKFKSEGVTLTFKKGKEEQKTSELDIEETESTVNSEEPAAEDVFLQAKASRASVYLKEGFSLRLALYVAKNTPIEMEFYQLNSQLQPILKRLRPATCWEENIGIDEIIQKEVIIRGRRYTEYQMYQAMLFPFTVQNVSFPAVSLKMLVTDASVTGKLKDKGIQTFSSKPSRVVVKPLPPHPQKDQIAVGEYTLKEQLTKENLASGESLRYLFTIAGRGNLATITAPEVPLVKAFDFYPPDMNQTVQRSYERVSGEKTFDYFIVAKQKGTYPLGRFFQWIYFNPSTARYDTLRSSKTITVAGEDMQSASILDANARLVYENVEQLDTTESYVDYQDMIRTLTNSVVLILLGIMGWILRK